MKPAASFIKRHLAMSDDSVGLRIEASEAGSLKDALGVYVYTYEDAFWYVIVPDTS